MRTHGVFVAGHRGLVGSALVRALEGRGEEVITADHQDLDLRDPAATLDFIRSSNPSRVIVAAGTVGGILANSTRPAEFLFDNLLIHANTIDASYRAGVDKLLYLGSSCIYPRMSTQPITEEQLLSGPLEPTNEPYAIAKISGIKLCDAYRAQYGCNFISAMPTNLYGPGDRFDLEGGHVLPSLMLKCHNAKLSGDDSIEVWGSGSALREFMHVDDVAQACLFLLDQFDEPGPINVGTGVEHSIKELAIMLRDHICPDVDLVFDPSKPEGTPRKVLDTSRLAEMGWTSTISLSEGIASTYTWLVEHPLP